MKMIPIKRELYPPNNPKGPTRPDDDILAIKRVVSRADHWPWGEFNNVYTEEFAKGRRNSKTKRLIKGQDGVWGLKKALGIKPVDGVWDKEVHELSQTLRVPKGKIHAGEPVWDAFARSLYQGFEDVTPQEELVKEIFGWWKWMVNREPSIFYDQERPITIISRGQKPPRTPFSDDCSGTFIGAAWLAGAKSPDLQYGYSGYGNTSSLVRCGFPISERDIAKYCEKYYIGAFYGTSIWNTVHVCAVEAPDKLYSHGREAGPEVIRNLHYHPYPLVALKAFQVL